MVKRPGRGFEHHPHLGSRLRKSRGITLLPLWVFVGCSGVKFTGRDWIDLAEDRDTWLALVNKLMNFWVS